MERVITGRVHATLLTRARIARSLLTVATQFVSTGRARTVFACVAPGGLDQRVTRLYRVPEILNAVETEIASTAPVLVKVDGQVPIVALPIAPMDVADTDCVKEEDLVCAILVGADLHVQTRLRVLGIRHARVTERVSTVHARVSLDGQVPIVEHQTAQMDACMASAKEGNAFAVQVGVGLHAVSQPALGLLLVTEMEIAKAVNVFVRQDLKGLIVSP